MAFEEITTEDVVETDVEDQEVVEPEEEEAEGTGAEDQEVTEPESEESEESGKTAADAAFAKMRRRAEEAERAQAEAQAELNKLKAEQAAREAALANMDIDEIDAIAEVKGISREEVLENLQREQDAAQAEIDSKEKDQLIENLRMQLDVVEAEKMMAEDLAMLQTKYDPSLKSLDDLGEDYAAYIAAGLSPEQAFKAIRGSEMFTKSTPAKAPGEITDAAPPEKDYVTEEEVANMTSQERYDNAEIIMASLPKWKKK